VRRMDRRNVQVIDTALNCTYDVYSVSENDFMLLFPNGQDVEFAEDFFAHLEMGRKLCGTEFGNRELTRSQSKVFTVRYSAISNTRNASIQPNVRAR